MVKLFFLILLLPLLGFILNILFGKKLNSEKISGYVSTFFVFIPFIISIFIFFELLNSAVEFRNISVNLFSWIITGNLQINFSYLIDSLSIVMVMIVTGVGSIIHFYSIGYMHKDAEFSKFFAYMNLFIFAMLTLVLADNFLLVFMGWEGVGLCSYLLIGFWYEKKFTGDAAKKAFVVNRIGDFGFIIAMLIIFQHFGTLNISVFLGYLTNDPSISGLLIAISLLLFIGATGKSAQIPLLVWLPDAMAGPTPVSALIHAATMVTAGVYLVARCSVLYALVPLTSNIILIIGIITALFAATIAIRQNDIKKILAYSTISQLGFMFIALGTYSYTTAIFHLTTHAFFKALLFLGSGSVIHAMSEQQDITVMGGLRTKMKTTFITFFIGSLAISGIPPLSGFFSKDEILFGVFSKSGIIPYVIILFTAGLTAFYMFRLVGLTFYGNPRYDENNIHPHESPITMKIPLIILAVLSTIGGFIGIPKFLGTNLIDHWFEPLFERAEGINALNTAISKTSTDIEIILLTVSVVVAVITIYFSFRKYSKQNIFEPAKGFGKVLENKYYLDEFYDKAVVNPIKNFSDKFLWNIFDIKIIDKFINGIANYLSRLSIDWRKIQSGIIQDYATLAVAGIVIIIFYLLLI